MLINQLIKAMNSLGEAIKQGKRDPREPGIREKMRLQRRIMAAFLRRFRRQQKIIITWAQTLPREIKATPDIPVMEDDTDFDAELLRLILTGTANGIDMTARTINVDADWTAANANAEKAMRKYAFKLKKEIDETTNERLRQLITSYITEPGMTIQDLKDRMRPIFGVVRSEMIAVTEVTRAYARGERLAAEQIRSDFPELRLIKTWYTNNDEIVCPICEPLNEQAVSFDEPFRSEQDGTVIEIEEPPGHVNCRCWQIIVTEMAE